MAIILRGDEQLKMNIQVTNYDSSDEMGSPSSVSRLFYLSIERMF
jgi:hypothetical protein